MNKKKILFIIQKINNGGAEKVLLNLSKSLSKKIYDVTLFLSRC